MRKTAQFLWMPLGAALLGASGCQFLTGGGEGQGNQYRVTVVKSDLVKKTVSATGILTPWKTVDIKSRAGGRLISLPVEEGKVVQKGDVIADIDPSDTLLTYNSARADIDSNQARIAETSKTLQLQKAESNITIATAAAGKTAAQATADAARARWQSAQSEADAQGILTEASIANAQANLAAEQQKLSQLSSASQPQSRSLAKSAVDQAAANLKNADAQLVRQKALLDKGFVAASQVDQYQASRDVAAATLESAQKKADTIDPEMTTDLEGQKARVAQFQAALRTAEANRVQIKLKAQAALAAKAEYEQSKAAVLQAKVKVDEAKAQRINDEIRLTQITQAKAARARSQASLVNADIQLKDTHVTAPSDGIILKKYVEQGTLITSGISFNSSGTSIVQLGDISRMYVDVQVDETDVASVDEGQKVDITFDAYPTTPYEGKVIKVEPQAVIDANVTTVHVRVEVDNSDIKFKLLKPGMNSTCEFIVEKKDNVLCVPNEAVKIDNDGNPYVEIAEGGKPAPPEKDSKPDPNLLVGLKPVTTKITVGLAGNETTEVTSGLKEGARVITQTIEPAPPPTGGGAFGGGGKGPGRK